MKIRRLSLSANEKLVAIERNLVPRSSRENSRALTRTREFKVELAKCSLGVQGVQGVQGETARTNALVGNSWSRLLQLTELPSNKAAPFRTYPTLLPPLLELLELLGLLYSTLDTCSRIFSNSALERTTS